MKSFRLKVFTPQKPIYEGDDIVSCVAPGELGYLGVLANHAPLVTTIVPGRLIYTDTSGSTKSMHIGAGILEILNNCVVVLTSSVL